MIGGISGRLRRWCMNTGFDGGPNSPPVLAANHIDALEKALTDLCAAMEYWAGCDEGVTPDVATSEIMSAGGAWPANAYGKGRAALASAREPIASVRRDSDFSWLVPRHATDTMVHAGLYHCTADMSFADLFTAFHYMVDEAQQDDRIVEALAHPRPALDREWSGVVANDPCQSADETDEDGNPCWYIEIQSIGGHSIIATIWGASPEQVQTRADAILARATPPASLPGESTGGAA